VRIRLTNVQVQQLQPYFDRVRATGALGTPGMLIAQLHQDQEGMYWLTPAFLDRDKAKVIAEQGREEIPGPIRRSE